MIAFRRNSINVDINKIYTKTGTTMKKEEEEEEGKKKKIYIPTFSCINHQVKDF